MTKGKVEPVSREDDEIGAKVVDAAFHVHVSLGPGLLESPVLSAQVLTYLKLTGLRLGYLINFNVPLVKDGIQRFAL